LQARVYVKPNYSDGLFYYNTCNQGSNTNTNAVAAAGAGFVFILFVFILLPIIILICIICCICHCMKQSAVPHHPHQTQVVSNSQGPQYNFVANGQAPRPVVHHQPQHVHYDNQGGLGQPVQVQQKSSVAKVEVKGFFGGWDTEPTQSEPTYSQPANNETSYTEPS
jgi:hypothetical protein